MLKKRIIPCLDIKDGRTVKGVNFKGLKDVGDPIELAKRYVKAGADELVFLDITATIEQRKTLIDLVRCIAKEINIPFTVGGGIKSVDDAVSIIEAGADKVAVNSAAIENSFLLYQIAKRLGSQCLVLAIDVKLDTGEWMVYRNGGRVATNWRIKDWAKEGERLGAGEILLTSMNSDGCKNGFSIDLINTINNSLNIPVIASGGAGSIEDFTQVFTKTNVSAALAASVFHFNEIQIPELKETLENNKIPVRWTSISRKEMA